MENGEWQPGREGAGNGERWHEAKRRDEDGKLGGGGGLLLYLGFHPTDVVHPIQRLEIARPHHADLKNRAVPGPALWAGEVVKARARCQARPGTGTRQAVPHQASAVLFRTGPVLAQRAWPIWKTIRSAAACRGRHLLARARLAVA